MGMLGAALVYVGFVLFMNSLKTLGKLKDSHVNPLNFFTGTLIVAGAIRTVLLHGEGITPYYYAMPSLMFGFTFLWVGINSIWSLEDDGLGWYCLFVTVVAVPTAFTTLPDLGMVVLWLMWASLWFMFFLLLSLHIKIAKITGYWTLVNAVVTSTAGYTILIKAWPLL